MYKVKTKHESVVHYFEKSETGKRRAKIYAEENDGKVFDCSTGKIIYNCCKEKNNSK